MNANEPVVPQRNFQPQDRVRVDRGLQEHTYPPNYNPPTDDMEDIQRWISGLSGAALVYYGLRQDNLSRWPLAALGAGLLYQGISGNNLLDYVPILNETPIVNQLTTREPTDLRVRKSITVNRPAEELYTYWRDLSNLPKFMRHVQSVQEMGDGQSHWVVKVLHGVELEWDARITVDRPNEMIAWETLPDATLQNRGYVKFIPISRGTEVSVSMEYDPPLSLGGALAGRAVKFIAAQEIKEEIRTFKRLMETGEVPTKEGQSSGRSDSHEGWNGDHHNERQNSQMQRG